MWLDFYFMWAISHEKCNKTTEIKKNQNEYKIHEIHEIIFNALIIKLQTVIYKHLSSETNLSGWYERAIIWISIILSQYSHCVNSHCIHEKSISLQSKFSASYRIGCLSKCRNTVNIIFMVCIDWNFDGSPFWIEMSSSVQLCCVAWIGKQNNEFYDSPPVVLSRAVKM